MEYLQKSKIKSLINSKGFRLNPEALDGINRSVENLIDSIITKTKEDGMKTVMPQHTHIKQATEPKATSNKLLINIKPEFAKLAKSIQDYCHEQAVILSRKV